MKLRLSHSHLLDACILAGMLMTFFIGFKSCLEAM